ncbi:hypothetical protein FKM82_016121 [Ascaphus truei]
MPVLLLWPVRDKRLAAGLAAIPTRTVHVILILGGGAAPAAPAALVTRQDNAASLYCREEGTQSPTATRFNEGCRPFTPSLYREHRGTYFLSPPPVQKH